MVISQRLDLRQSQTLVMTPQLQQAIKLLQMSNQELGTFVAEEVEKNPLLERVEESGDPVDADALREQMTVSREALEGGSGGEAPASGEAPYEGSVSGSDDKPLSGEDLSVGSTDSAGAEAWDSEGYGFDETSPSAGHGSGDDSFSAVQNVAVGTSLREHLIGQIHVDFVDPAERLIATALVEFLDDAGYLPAELDLARAQLGASEELFERVITKLQRLDPAGIFARSLPECLAAQLREKNRLDPAMKILLEHLDLVARHERAALMKLCGVDAEDLAQMLAELRELDPKPAAAFVADVAPPVTPDVMLRPTPGGGWQVELNSENLPRVLVNERYYTQVQNATRAKPDKDYLSERWQQANWLVKALHQRATTILKVAAEIVRQQDKFFIHGVQFLKPLTLRDIAAAVEMHESTVSRVTQNKYMTTPRGLFELKYFFTNAIATVGGTEVVAAVAVRDRIKSLIDEESPDAILSDDKIVDLLRREGIELARRTVAKYREALHIPSSAQRRREKRDTGR